MKERPIIFSGEMVKAILEDRKTQTRRIVKPQPYQDGIFDKKRIILYKGHEREQWCWFISDGSLRNYDLRFCPYGKIGDRLWIRETWQTAGGKTVTYRADWDRTKIKTSDLIKWKPSIHMPRWASRITLEITDIRVERLQEISEWDCLKEGVVIDKDCENEEQKLKSALVSFLELWDSINEKRGYGWDTNCWVWVISFRRLK